MIREIVGEEENVLYIGNIDNIKPLMGNRQFYALAKHISEDVNIKYIEVDQFKINRNNRLYNVESLKIYQKGTLEHKCNLNGCDITVNNLSSCETSMIYL